MRYGKLNANQIKLIAIIAMTIDHLTWAFFPGTQAVWYVFALHGHSYMRRFILSFLINYTAYFRCLPSSRYRFCHSTMEKEENGKA